MNPPALPRGVSSLPIDAIEQHGILPLVYAATHDEALREASVNAATFEALRLADLRGVLAALDARGIRPLILKGRLSRTRSIRRRSCVRAAIPICSSIAPSCPRCAR